jgi:hypothetical protein
MTTETLVPMILLRGQTDYVMVCNASRRSPFSFPQIAKRDRDMSHRLRESHAKTGAARRMPCRRDVGPIASRRDSFMQ